MLGLTAVTVAALVLPARTEAQTNPPYVGEVPREGVALLMASTTVAPSELASALDAARCAPEVLAVTVGGQWRIYVPGAPAFVNEGFPSSIVQWTGFFVRCRAMAAPTPTATSTPTPGS